jgi:hypothetical protein
MTVIAKFFLLCGALQFDEFFIFFGKTAIGIFFQKKKRNTNNKKTTKPPHRTNNKPPDQPQSQGGGGGGGGGDSNRGYRIEEKLKKQQQKSSYSRAVRTETSIRQVHQIPLSCSAPFPPTKAPREHEK